VLSGEEIKTLQELEGRYYMSPVISRLNGLVARHGHKEAFKYLHPIIRDAQCEVMEKRKSRIWIWYFTRSMTTEMFKL